MMISAVGVYVWGGGTSAELASQKTRPKEGGESGCTFVIQTNKLLHVQRSFKSVYSSAL